jgi:outer membrane protein OmpA-like peptidoglycan-associated protein
MRLTTLTACLLALAAPAAAQQTEMFIPGAGGGPDFNLPADNMPEIRNRLAACLANPSAATCTGVQADADGGVTFESTAGPPQITYETLVFDPNGGVKAADAPPPSPPDYSAPVVANAPVALPSVAITVEFDYDSASIRPDQLGKIAGLTEALNDPGLQGTAYAVIGHTDAAGSDAYNCELSRRRAAEVTRVLKGAYVNLPLYPVGFGESVLKNTYDPRAPENRRVSFLRLPDNPRQVLDTAAVVCGGRAAY